MQLDELDQKILKELEGNARISVQEIARKTDTKRTTALYRLNKLISNGVLSFACIPNVEKLEYQIPLGLGINVSSGKTDLVAQKLIDLPEVKVVNLVAGRFAIFAWCLLRDKKELTQFFSENLANIQDITSIEMIYAYQWIRDSWRYFTLMQRIPNGSVEFTPSEVDLAIIRSLQQDPRQSTTNLAKSAGCSKPVAKERLNALVDKGIIQLVSMINPAAMGYQIEAMILLKSPPSQAIDVANQMSTQNFVRHASLTTGTWQIFISAQFWDNAHMREFLSDTLVKSPGVTDFEVIQIMKTLKFSMVFVNTM
jgi:Lrp/AsnC family transcriptional regulator for asnA, asnC and gidA